MFPKNVYHCPCVDLQIKLCLVNGQYLLSDICNKLRKEIVGDNIYYCKCGNDLQHVIFSCRKHMSLKSVCELHKNQRCYNCIKTYLRLAYDCCYNHTSFDIPMSVKKQKKTLMLMVQKCKNK